MYQRPLFTGWLAQSQHLVILSETYSEYKIHTVVNVQSHAWESYDCELIQMEIARLGIAQLGIACLKITQLGIA